MKPEVHRFLNQISQEPSRYEDYVGRSEAIRTLLKLTGYEASVNLILRYLRGQMSRFFPAEATTIDGYINELLSALKTEQLPDVPPQVDTDYSGIKAGMNNFMGTLYDVRRTIQGKASPENWSETLEEALGCAVLGALSAHWEETHPGWGRLFKTYVDTMMISGDLEGLPVEADLKAISEAGAYRMRPEAKEFEHQQWLIVANKFEQLLDSQSGSSA